jgi:hypothetical protein
MYVIHCTKKGGNNTWEFMAGEDTLHEFVSNLVDAGFQRDDIRVFPAENEI